MRISIITASMPPFHCGIGDHSLYLAATLRQQGCEVSIIACRGEATDGVSIVDCDWEIRSLERLFRKLAELQTDLVLIQFTPLMYSDANRWDGRGIVPFWEKCAGSWKTAIIVHETYFRSWRYPPSWVRGSREKAFLQRMVSHSHYVFSASQPLVNEMGGWERERDVSLLPIGSNFPFVEIDRDAARIERGIGTDEIVLVLFGGGNSLKWMKRHVHATDTLLHSEGINAKWLMLGGITSSWFRLKLPVVSLGRVDEREMSIRLQTSDIFLMPHYAGLCAKRGTLMAAMQHGLPVVGSRTAMTEQFWENVEGVRLAPRRDARVFAEQVLALSRNHDARKIMGSANRQYFHDHFTWETIAQIFLDSVGR